MSVIGIDIGNDAFCIAQTKRGDIDLILNENSNRRNPTMVSVQGKQRFMGEAASSYVSIPQSAVSLAEGCPHRARTLLPPTGAAY